MTHCQKPRPVLMSKKSEVLFQNKKRSPAMPSVPIVWSTLKCENITQVVQRTIRRDFETTCNQQTQLRTHKVWLQQRNREGRVEISLCKGAEGRGMWRMWRYNSENETEEANKRKKQRGTDWVSTTPDCGVTNKMRSLKRKKWVVFGSRNLVGKRENVKKRGWKS